MVITGGKGGWGKVEEGKAGINGNGGRLRVVNTIQYRDDVSQNCTPETYIILLTNVTQYIQLKIK